MIEHKGLKRRPEQVHHHIIIRILTPHLYNLRNAKISDRVLSLNLFDDLSLVVQLRLADRPHLYLDSNHRLIFKMYCLEDLIKGVET